MSELIDAIGWAIREDFSPLSPPQVMKYLRHRKYRIPTERSTGKPTTIDEGLSGIIRPLPVAAYAVFLSPRPH